MQLLKRDESHRYPNNSHPKSSALSLSLDYSENNLVAYCTDDLSRKRREFGLNCHDPARRTESCSDHWPVRDHANFFRRIEQQNDRPALLAKGKALKMFNDKILPIPMEKMLRFSLLKPRNY